MRILLIAPPGAGKGTQGRRLAADYGITYISTGDLLRAHVAAGDELGRRVAAVLASGDLVPDDIMEELLYERLVTAAEDGGWVLDGFPRTLHQAQAAYDFARDLGITLHAAIALQVDDETVLRRMLARAGTEGRLDDSEHVIRHRLEVYHEQTEPLLDYYDGRGLLYRVDASGAPDEVYAAIREITDTLPVDPPLEVL